MKNKRPLSIEKNLREREKMPNHNYKKQFF